MEEERGEIIIVWVQAKSITKKKQVFDFFSTVRLGSRARGEEWGGEECTAVKVDVTLIPFPPPSLSVALCPFSPVAVPQRRSGGRGKKLVFNNNNNNSSQESSRLFLKNPLWQRDAYDMM